MKADLTMKEVSAPHGNWCSTGHEASETFRREGADFEPLPTRFFRISSDKNPEVNGVYCEPCLVVANAIKRKIEIYNG